MSLIVLERASLSFGPQSILEEVNLRISEGERIGLVGANGTGKSTLLKVMTGRHALDSGQVSRTRGTRIGYLPQEAIELPAADHREVFEMALYDNNREVARRARKVTRGQGFSVMNW